MTVQPVFFHVDLDAFFASVEQLDNPQYRGKPVIVGGEIGKRGVVSTCSYEARKFGVHSAMPMGRAYQLCPDGIYLRGRMHRYHELSRQVMHIFESFSPAVQQMSIDEAFLDMSGTEKLFGPAEGTARRLKEQVYTETGLTISAGIASNRYIAKIASGLSKPDGLVQVKSGEEGSFMASLRLKDVWGIGEKSRNRLEEAGLATVPALLKCSPALLQGLLGQAGGSFLHSVIHGIDPDIFTGETASRSISSEHTFEYDIGDLEIIETEILELSSDVMFRLLDEGLSGRTVQVKIRYSDFRTVSIQETGETALNDTGDLYERARNLFLKKYDRSSPVRLLGVGIHNVSETRLPEQLFLFDAQDSSRKRKVEEAVFALAKKRGKRLVTRARLIEKTDSRDT